MKNVLLKKKSHLDWSWILMVLFFILSIFNIYFALLGLICMAAPLYHVSKGRGKINCSHYCPRGSLFGKFFPHISMNKSLPLWVRSHWFKNIVLIFMFSVLGYGIYKSGGSIKNISTAVFRLIVMSTVVGTLLGIFFKPRSWCQVCPMGHVTGVISKKDGNTKGDVK